MNFFKKLFSKSEPSIITPEEKRPDNTRLLYLISNWTDHPSVFNYGEVVKELREGSSFLLLPSINDINQSTNWSTLEADTTLKLTSVVDLDGLKAIAVFTDEQSMIGWTKEKTSYTALKSNDVLNFCRQNSIDRIVINSNQRNMFVLQWQYENIKTTVVEKDTKILIGAPASPLPKLIIDKLISNFERVGTIAEAYHYLMNKDEELSYVIGIILTSDNNESRLALRNAISRSIEGQQLALPLDVLVLDSKDMIESVRDIKNSLVYKKH